MNIDICKINITLKLVKVGGIYWKVIAKKYENEMRLSLELYSNY